VGQSPFSPLWYRVAGQHPHLSAHVRVQRQTFRDQVWYVLINETTGRQYRLNRIAYQLIGRCDGRRSIQEVWDALLEEFRDEAPTQDEVIRLLLQLDQQGMLNHEATRDIDGLVRQQDQRARQQRRAFLNPLAFRVPLGDPSRQLKRLDSWAMALCHPATLSIWIVLMLVAGAAAASNFRALSTHASTYMNTPHYLFLAWLTFPFIKAVHELAHALAVRRWGGEVRSVGISLMVLTPTPYVDASAAAGFVARSQRAVVGAIGVMIELALAAVALFVWLNVQPGVVRDIAFVTMMVASVSTLLFNGNPLLSFDAYYVMCDMLDLPNLATRSKSYWIDLLQCFVFGRSGPSSLQPAIGEQKWLAAYAPLSAAYRLFVSALIVLWVGGHSVLLGVLVGVFVLATALAKPVVAALGHVLRHLPAGRLRWRALGLVGATAAGLLALTCWVAFPYCTAAPGVIWLPDEAQVRPDTDGFITTLVANDGDQVSKGQLLLVMDDPALVSARDKLASQLEQFQADRFDSLLRDAQRAQNIEQDIARVQSELDWVERKLALLQVRAQVDGTLVLLRPQDLRGIFARRGGTLGYILDRADFRVRAVVPEQDAVLVRERTRRVEVRLAEAAGKPLTAQLVRDIPAATHELPSAALGDRGGGAFVTDPADKDALRTLEPVVLVDVMLPKEILQRIGGRAWVRFDHGGEALASQCYRRLRQLFLQHFSPTG